MQLKIKQLKFRYLGNKLNKKIYKFCIFQTPVKKIRQNIETLPRHYQPSQVCTVDKNTCRKIAHTLGPQERVGKQPRILIMDKRERNV